MFNWDWNSDTRIILHSTLNICVVQFHASNINIIPKTSRCDSPWHILTLSGGTLRRRHLLHSLPLPRCQQRCSSRSEVYQVKRTDTTSLGTRGEDHERLDHQSGSTSALAFYYLNCFRLILAQQAVFCMLFESQGSKVKVVVWSIIFNYVIWQMKDWNAVANDPRTPKGCGVFCV